MGTNTLGTYAGGDIIPPDCVNQYKTALNQDLVPRNASGVATDNAGDLGDTSNKWRKAHINSGYWHIGDIKAHHSYNGLIGPGEGFMLCDGRVINETNYDSEHGSGHWDDYIVSSALDGKYLPNLTNKYQVGASTTNQDGSSSITSVGNSGHQIDIAHTHSHSHNHQWYKYNGTGADHDDTYNSSGGLLELGEAGKSSGYKHLLVSRDGGAAYAPTDSYTSSPDDSTTSSSLSSSQSIKPESIEVQYYMRII